MGIAIFIQNQAHRRVEEVLDLSESILDAISSAPDGSLLKGIHPHADTMFNTAQLEFLIKEISVLESKGHIEQGVLAVLRQAADAAILQRGYLWFSGD